MDYCSTCRRHLNGALVCPGCGACAPDIAPSVVDGRTVVARVATAPTGTVTTGAGAWEPTARAAWHEEPAGDTAAVGARTDGRDGAPQADPSGDPVAVATAPPGRAARRRQLARWKKTQRRALIATAVAFVGGGLTVASNPFDRHSADRALATTTPDTAGMGVAEKPLEQHDLPVADAPTTPSPSPTRPARSAVTEDARREPTMPPAARPDAAAVPPAAVPVAPQPRTTPPVSGSDEAVSDAAGTGAAGDTGAAAPPAVDDAADPEASQPSPEPSATSPEKVCLLVICLG